MRPTEQDQNVVELVERAERVLDQQLPVFQADLDAAAKQAWLVQMSRLFEEITKPEWPPIENRAAGAIGVGPGDIDRAPLPTAYRQAKAALRTCERIDECKEWSNKAQAIAAYARMAKDRELYNTALRIQLRAKRRCGELLDQIHATRGRPKIIDGGVTNSVTRAGAAAEAGLSERQKTTALRLAAIPGDEFESLVESPHPPTLTRLSDYGRQEKPAKRATSPNVAGTHLFKVDYQYDRALSIEEIATERDLAMLMYAWRTACPEARKRFLDTLGLGSRAS